MHLRPYLECIIEKYTEFIKMFAVPYYMKRIVLIVLLNNINRSYIHDINRRLSESLCIEENFMYIFKICQIFSIN